MRPVGYGTSQPEGRVGDVEPVKRAVWTVRLPLKSGEKISAAAARIQKARRAIFFQRNVSEYAPCEPIVVAVGVAERSLGVPLVVGPSDFVRSGGWSGGGALQVFVIAS